MRSWSLLVPHAALDVAELEHGEGDHDQHQDHRLRRGAAEVEAFDAVAVDLVDQDLGRARAGPPESRRG